MVETQSSRSVAPVPPAKRPEDLATSPEFLYVVGALVALLFFAALVLWFLDRWRKRGEAAEDLGISLTNFRGMYEAGEITLEEYDRIRAKMAGKMKAKLGVEAPPAPPPVAPPKSE